MILVKGKGEMRTYFVLDPLPPATFGVAPGLLLAATASAAPTASIGEGAPWAAHAGSSPRGLASPSASAI